MKKTTKSTLVVLAISFVLLVFASVFRDLVPERRVEEKHGIVRRDTIYLALGEEYDLPEGEYTCKSPCLQLDGSRIKGIVEGVAIVKSDHEVIPVTVSSLYTVPVINNSKEFLPCGFYSQQDNMFLDMILQQKIKEGGIRSRAGAVACARFMSLQFRYRLPYFYENGRLTKGNVPIDGEGRFYHKGLYLNEYKYDVIEYPSKGPAVWGCPLYSLELRETAVNGFDCSGYITWSSTMPDMIRETSARDPVPTSRT